MIENTLDGMTMMILMLEEMWKDGESLEEIANRLDRTVGAIEALELGRKKLMRKQVDAYHLLIPQLNYPQSIRLPRNSYLQKRCVGKDRRDVKQAYKYHI